jgi:hypothetical protein
LCRLLGVLHGSIVTGRGLSGKTSRVASCWLQILPEKATAWYYNVTLRIKWPTIWKIVLQRYVQLAFLGRFTKSSVLSV